MAEEREKTLIKLQGTLQSQLSPKIERVLNNDSSEDFEYYVNVYTTLGGKEDLKNMYANMKDSKHCSTLKNCTNVSNESKHTKCVQTYPIYGTSVI